LDALSFIVPFMDAYGFVMKLVYVSIVWASWWLEWKAAVTRRQKKRIQMV
jgi:hypothetical protein